MRYLENELSESERTSFENDLKKDSELLEEYKLHLELDEFLEMKFKGEI